MTEYSIKINRRDGRLEVAGDKEWVDAKLQELADVYGDLPTVDNGDPGTASKRRPKARATKTSTTGNTATKQPRRRKSSRPQKNAELAGKLTSQVKRKLQEYRDARSTAFDKKAPNAVAIIAGALREELEITEVSEDDLYTVFSVMGWSAPNITKAVLNAYSRDHYFGGATGGKRELTQAGESFARHGSVDEG
jgi:hypothetical protein